MNNIKLTEFIIANEKFYNLLAPLEKQMISYLDFYNINLYIMKDDQVYFKDCHKDNSGMNEYYIYIGYRGEDFYYYKLNVIHGKADVSSGIIEIRRPYRILKELELV